MRTPPPVLPPGKGNSPDDKRTWFDSEGPDAGLRLTAASRGGMVAAIAFVALMLFAALRGHVTGGDLRGAFVVAVVLGAVSYFKGFGAGAIARSFTLPSGNSTPYAQTFSYQEAMAAKGDVEGALESYESILKEQPEAIAPRLAAAEHYARGNRNPARAAELFREIRGIAGVPVRDALYASSRLVDLYDGPLEEPGRAAVELRRLIEQYPNSRAAKHARTALPALKARLGGADEK